MHSGLGLMFVVVCIFHRQTDGRTESLWLLQRSALRATRTRCNDLDEDGDGDDDIDDCNHGDNAKCYRPSQSLVMAFRLYPVSQTSHFTAAGDSCADALHDVHPVEHSVISKHDELHLKRLQRAVMHDTTVTSNSIIKMPTRGG